MNAKVGAGKGKRKGRKATPLGDIPPRLHGILLAVPVRNEREMEWEVDATGLVTITHKKNLHRWEKWLMKKVGGSPIIHRKLDKPGSDIWQLCDGKRTVADICGIMDRRYKEDMEPVLTRVVKFLEILLMRNLIFLQRTPALENGGGGS
jgi:hypothetical protein